MSNSGASGCAKSVPIEHSPCNHLAFWEMQNVEVVLSSSLDLMVLAFFLFPWGLACYDAILKDYC